jgi:hypothetical protein
MVSKFLRVLPVASLAAAAFASSQADATLLLRAGFQNAAMSIDACGITPDPTCTVQTNVPAGSTVLAAYLYSADIFGSGLGDVSLNGTNYTVASGTQLTPNTNPANSIVWNVTSQMKPLIEGGGFGLQNQTVTESQDMDGEILVVVYSNASTAGQSVALLDGELAQGGDTTTVNFASPYTGGNFLMSLGISFGFQPTGQVSLVDVTTNSTASRRLTSCAGGQDDGQGADGALITAGGIGDSSANPEPTCSGSDPASPRQDDELYDLSQGNSANADPFIHNGDTFLQLDTSNPSFDDNVFFLAIQSGFTLSSVDQNPIGPSAPEPATAALLGLGLLGLARLRRKRAS